MIKPLVKIQNKEYVDADRWVEKIFTIQYIKN